MKALVYHGPGHRQFDEVPDPQISDPADAVVRVDAVTICGTDLHILGGDVPTCDPGRILGEIRGLLARAGPTPREVLLLRGIARQVQWAGSTLSRARGSG